MITKDEAARQCKEIVQAFCEELNIESPSLSYEELWSETRDVNKDGHIIRFRPAYRYLGRGGFRWFDENYENNVEITYKADEVAHPECDYCEHSVAIEKPISTPNQAIDFAREIKQGKWE